MLLTSFTVNMQTYNIGTHILDLKCSNQKTTVLTEKVSVSFLSSFLLSVTGHSYIR